MRAAPTDAAGRSGPGATLLKVARQCSPRVDVRAETTVVLAVDGLARLFGDDKAVGDRLRRVAADAGLVGVHVGLAATRTTAMLCAAARAGVTVVPAGEEAAVLAPMPLRMLEVFLAGPAGHAAAHHPLLPVLSRWGIRTLGQFAALPAAELSERLGQEGLWWQRLARGEDTGPLVPTPEEESCEATAELEWPIEGLEPLSFVLGGLLESLCQRLERRDRGAAVLHLHLRLITKDTHTRSLQLPAPMRDAKVLRTLLLLDLESHQAPAGVDRVTVSIEPTPGRIVQESLLTRALPAPEQVSTLLARLGALMGDTRCGSPALVDSHRPGAFAMAPFCVPDSRVSRATSTSRLRDDTMGGGGRFQCHVDREGGGATAGAQTACLRRFRLPIPARVLIDRNRPIVVKTDRPGLPGGRVCVCAGPWRTSGEWWKTGDAPGTSGMAALRGLAGWNRDEWDVALGDGGRYRIFEDRESGRWFIDAVVD